jgi:hypothetical protein
MILQKTMNHKSVDKDLNTVIVNRERKIKSKVNVIVSVNDVII